MEVALFPLHQSFDVYQDSPGCYSDKFHMGLGGVGGMILTDEQTTSRGKPCTSTTAQHPLVDQGLFIIEALRSHMLRLLWTKYQPDAENST